MSDCRSIAALVVLATFVPGQAAGPTTAPAVDPNHVVLEAARSFADGGGYNVKWAGSGTPQEVRFNGQRVLAKGTDGTYCCGFTFAVAMKAGMEMGLFDGKSIERIKRFQKEWYGAVDEPDIREKQCSVAVERLGVGRSIPPDEARPGDFMQFWRTPKGGHSVIFLDWIEKNGKHIGFRYRSSQGSTMGIGDTEEYFSDTGIEKARVLRDRIYFGRFEKP
jgi:hypothetical protein